MNYKEQILIGGQALIKLGSSRSTDDTDYLVNDNETKHMFIHDKDQNIDYVNANGHKFFAQIFDKETGNEIASPESLLELKAFSFVQHCQNFNFQKADDCEYDMKFLVRKFNLKAPQIVRGHVSDGEYSEIMKVVGSVKF